MFTARRTSQLTVSAALLVAILLLAGCDWTQFRYGPEHSGFNPTETNINTGNVGTLTEAWSGATGNYLYSSPTVANGVAYVVVADLAGYVVVARLAAFDAAGHANCSGTPKTCDPLWTAVAGDAAVSSSPAVADGVVYIGSSAGRLSAFDAAGDANCSGTPKTCAPLWTADTGNGVDSSPVVTNGVVYVGAGPSDHMSNGKLIAFDAAGLRNCSGTPKTCAPLWTATTLTDPSSPAVANGVVYARYWDGTASFYLAAFDAAGQTGCAGEPKTCVPLWTVRPPGGVATSPAVANGDVYFGSYDGQLYAIDAPGRTNCSGTPKICAPLWSADTGSGVVSAPAVANGVAYVGVGPSWDGSTDGELIAFDAAGRTNCAGTPKTCTPLWTTGAGGGGVVSSPAVANGVVYAGSREGKLSAFDAAGDANCSGTSKICAPLWTADTGSSAVSSPAVANGVVYAGSDDAKLHAWRLP